MKKLSVAAVAFGLATMAIAQETSDKQAVFDQLALAEGRWVTELSITEVEVNAAGEGGAVTADMLAELEGQQGHSFETEDCIGNRLAADGTVILPGVAIGARCGFVDHQIAADHFNLAVSCVRDDGAEFSRVLIDARHDEDVMNAVVDVEIEATGYTTKMRLVTRSRREGVCSRQ